MRKKHQAVLISSAAKKNFCNEISLGNFTYESEVKEQLREFFNNNIRQEDVDSPNENSDNSSDEESFEVSQVKVPKQVVNNTKEFAKFQIAEKAIISGIESNNYEKIPQKSLNINYSNSEYNDEDNKDLGATIKFLDIIKQCIFWKDKGEDKGKKNVDIDCFQLFNLDPDKIKYIKEKINEFKKIAKEKKLEGPDSMVKNFLTELENNFTEQKNELNNLISNLEYIDTVSYGKKWSMVNVQKVKIVNQNDPI